MAAATAGHGTNLPADVTLFVGRRDELDEIKRSLGSSRLVTIMGVGGVGKTRLALRAAFQAQGAFPDGVWLVELASLQTEELLAQAVVSALGIRDQASRWTTESLAEHIADKQLLLVLDNCEHLQAACADLAATLLKKVPPPSHTRHQQASLGHRGRTHATTTATPFPNS